jgi:hypothetical protein
MLQKEPARPSRRPLTRAPQGEVIGFEKGAAAPEPSVGKTIETRIIRLQPGDSVSDHATKFKAVLRKGSGRAALLLESDPADEELQAALLDACKRNLAYDPQCEEGREPYLHRLIVMTRRSQLFWMELLRCLDEFRPADDARDIVQIYGVLCLLAPGQNDNDRGRLREFIESDAVRKSDFCDVARPCGEGLIRLEGLGTFLLLIRLYHSELLEDFREETGWAYRSWVDALNERDGAEATAAALESARSASAELDQLMSLAVIEDGKLDHPPVERRDDKDTLDYAAVKAELSPMKGFPRCWVQAASVDELILAASDLLIEKDERKIRAYLLIFTRRDYPLDPETLFPIAKGENPRNAWQAIRVLQRLHDCRVRNLALELLEKGSEIAEGIRLLCSNYLPGDFKLIERAVQEAQFDEEGWHSVGLSVLSLLDAAPVPPSESRDILLQLYERHPCSICRKNIVEKLHEHDLVPEWMARECAFDAHPETAKLFAKPSNSSSVNV